MPSRVCDALRRQGYQFFSPRSSAALKPCLWCKRALCGDEGCYKQQFYGIASHRCVQLAPTLSCNQRCLFCWRSFEHEFEKEEEASPEEILEGIKKLQKKALAGYNTILDNTVTPERWDEALTPKHIAISLSGEPTLYSQLPELIDLCTHKGYTTFLVSNGTKPDVLRRSWPTQLYVTLAAPDRETYLQLCRPKTDTWDKIQESLSLLKGRRSAVRITLVKGYNDHSPETYASLIQKSGAQFVEVKAYMHLGYSQGRLERGHMPDHTEIRRFADKIAESSEYSIWGERRESRVVCLMKKGGEREEVSPHRIMPE